MEHNLKNMKTEALEEIKECLDNGYSGIYCELHNEVFNTGYYIIGTEAAKQALREFDVFDAIEKVMEYEKDNFGEVNTEIYNPEKLVNMLFYVIGEEVIAEIKSIDDPWNEYADEETNKKIIAEINVLLEKFN